MKKSLLISLMAILLAGCSGTGTLPTVPTSSGEEPSSTEEPSSSSAPSSEAPSSEPSSESSSISSSSTESSSETSSSEETCSSSTDTRREEIKNFLNEIYSFNGHPNKASVTSETVDYYGGLEMESKDEFTIERFYREGASDISIRQGTYTVGDSVNDYVTQTFVQDGYIYMLTKYGDVPEGKSSGEYDASMLELNIGFSLYYIQESNLAYLANFLDNSSYLCELDLPGEIPFEGTTSFSYAISALNTSGTVDQKISHVWSIVTKGGVIQNYVHDYANELYVTGEVINSRITKETVSYTQGEYALFSGELWNPDDFPEAA